MAVHLPFPAMHQFRQPPGWQCIYDQAKHDEVHFAHGITVGADWAQQLMSAQQLAERAIVPFALAIRSVTFSTLIVAAPSESFLHVLHTCVLTQCALSAGAARVGGHCLTRVGLGRVGYGCGAESLVPAGGARVGGAAGERGGAGRAGDVPL